MNNKRQKRSKRKQNRRNGMFLGRTFIICIEIFVLVVVVGVSLVLGWVRGWDEGHQSSTGAEV